MEINTDKTNFQNLFLFALFALLLVAVIAILKPFFSVILWSSLLYILVSPLYRKISSHLNPDKKGLVEFKNVGFKYPDSDEEVLSDITFTAKPGETTAIIGSTGSGKSTIVNLIPRFYDITSGNLLIDGVDIKDISNKDLRKIIEETGDDEDEDDFEEYEE